MASLFISYSRKDIEIARRLTEAFKVRSFDFWIDWEDIPPTVDWWKEIQKGIEEADTFLFLISHSSAKSPICRQEIEYAVSNGKRLIPIVLVDIQGDATPPELRQLNWIFLRENDNFEMAFDKLMIAIQSDFAWAQVHRQLQVKSLEWERANHDNSFLLRGIELQNAELQLATNGSKEPYPTKLQREYVLTSRQLSDKQRRTTSSITFFVAITLALLAIFGFVQAERATANAQKEQAASTLAVSNANTAESASTLAINNAATADANAAEAVKQSRISRSNELAAEAMSVQATDFQVSSLLAVEALNASDTVQARSVLMENLRMNPQAQAYLIGHDTSVTCVAFSPDGTILASASDDGIVLLWSLETYRLVGEPLKGHTAAITSMAFSPDGKILASGSADKTIRLWDVQTGSSIGKPLTGHTDSISKVMFTKDGQTLASWAMNDHVFFWDVKTSQKVNTLQAPSHIRTIALSPDGQTLATAENAAITLWNVKNLQPVGQLLHKGAALTNIIFSPDGRTVASGSADGSITFWDVEHQNEIYSSLGGVAGPIKSTAFSADGKTLVSGSEDGEILLHFTFIGERAVGVVLGGLNSIAISPDGTMIATNEKNKIVLWNVEEDQLITRKLAGSAGDLYSVAFSPDGKLLVSGYFSSTTRLWDLTTNPPVDRTLNRESDQMTTMRFSQNNKLLALRSIAGYRYIDLWNITTKKFIDPPIDGYQVIDFSSDGKILALSSFTGTILFWDLDRDKQVGQPLDGYYSITPLDAKTMIFQSDHDIVIWDNSTQEPVHLSLSGGQVLAINKDCKVLAWEDNAGDIQLWNIDMRKPIGLPFREYTYWISDTAFSPDGKILAISVDYGTINLWDTATGELIGPPLRAANGVVPNLAFSPDGRLLAAGSMINTVLWDMQTRTPLGQPLDGINFGLTPESLAFSPDGKWLATIGEQKQTIILWDLDPYSWKDKTCQRVGRNFTLDEWIHYFPNEQYRVTCPQWPSQPELITTPQPAG